MGVLTAAETDRRLSPIKALPVMLMQDTFLTVLRRSQVQKRVNQDVKHRDRNRPSPRAHC